MSKVPLVILAGSDPRRGAVPAGGEGFHYLVGYKGADLKIGGRPLIVELISRCRQSDAFGDIYVAGPQRVFGEIVDCRVIDTDGSVGDNVQAAINGVTADCGQDSRIAFLSCDVLPTASELSELMAGLLVREGGEDVDSMPALAISLVTAPENLGASVWKPRYVIRSSDGDDPIPFLPSHLGVADPKKLRTGLLFRTIALVYRERNRDYEQRRRDMVVRLLGVLLWRDLMNVLRLHPPTLTYSAIRYGLGAFRAWQKKQLTIDELATAIEKMIVHRQYHRKPASGCVRIVITPHMSFAKDIDTKEELDEVASQYRESHPE